MADFEFHASFSPASTRRPRVLTTRFGDGYEQRAADGIHADLQTWALPFDAVPTEEAEAIEAFLVSKGGVIPFTWVPPRGALDLTGSTWVLRANPEDIELSAVTYANGIFVAVATATHTFGTGNSAIWSGDGKIWYAGTGTTTLAWNAVTFGAGQFVAVSSNGTGNRVMTSVDGKAWVSRTSSIDNQWIGVAWGAGTFVAVANSGTLTRVMTSVDGIAWQTRTTPAGDFNWNAVTYGAGLFVAVAETGVTQRVMTSPDGAAWTLRNAAADNSWRAVHWNGALFVAVARTGTGNRVMTSTNGTSWTIRTSASDSDWRGVCWNGTYWIAIADVDQNSLSRVMTSLDGISWTSRTITDGAAWKALVSNGTGMTVAVGRSGWEPNAMYSSDGITFKKAEGSVPTQDWIGACWGQDLFVAVCNTGSFPGQFAMTSPNGLTWTIRTTPADEDWDAVCWGAPSGTGIFVAVAVSGTGNRAMSSPDGAAWTIRTSAADNNWTSVAWNGTIFCAVANTGANNRAMSSTNGTSWTIRTGMEDNSWNGIAAKGNLFAAVASTGTNRVMTSTDAVTWTPRSVPASAWMAIASNGVIFCAVNTNAAGARVMTSSDGITWTAQTTPTDLDAAWKSICWDGSKFVAFADSGPSEGANKRVMTSTDGITWTARNSSHHAVWRGAASDGRGKIVATARTAIDNISTTDSAEIKVICREWTRTMESPNTDSLRITFEEVAEP